MTRRQFFSLISASIAASPVLGFCGRGKERPNVLLIIADDMNGYGFYKAYKGVKTPCLDAFKKQALTFSRAYCAAPACVPSRAAMFSGLYPHNTGCYRNGGDPWKRQPFTELEALPEIFKAAGYITWGRGKLTHSMPPKARHSSWWDNQYWGGGFGPFPDEQHRLKGKFWGIQSFPDEDFPDVINGNDAIKFLEKAHEQPFFMVYGLWRPHTPFTAPRRFYKMYDPAELTIPVPGWKKDDLADVPEWGVKLSKVWAERYDLCGEADPDEWRRFVHAYCATTSFADWSCGRVIEALDKSPYADNTIVIFVSDNGYHCGEKNHWEKTTLWEKSALTPMAIRVPGMQVAGRQCHRPVSSLDIWPTLTDYCGLRPPKQGLDGQSLKLLIDNPDAPWERPAITTYGEGFISLRDQRYRYIRYPDGTEELYDLDNDPYEFDNLAGQPESAEIKKRASEWIPEHFAPSLGGRFG